MEKNRTQDIIQKAKEQLERDITITLKAKQVTSICRLIWNLLDEKRQQIDVDYYESLVDTLHESLKRT